LAGRRRACWKFYLPEWQIITMLAKLSALCYLVLILLQPLWLWWLPAPQGYESLWLAVIFTALLLFPVTGIVRGSLRKAIIGAYLSLPHFMFAVAESWASPAVRNLALLQLFLVLSFWLLQIQRGRLRGRLRSR